MVNIDPSVIITQAELENIQQLRQSIYQLQAECEDQRQVIIQKYESGAPIEPGPLTASVTPEIRKIPTWSQVAEVMGRAMTAALKRLVQPTRMKRLDISDSYRDQR